MDLDLALQRFDLPAYVREHAASKVGRNEWLVLCPGCGKEKLSINTAEKRWRCFVCEQYGKGADGRTHALVGAGGVVSLVRWLEGLSTRQAIQHIIASVRPTWGDPSHIPPLPELAAAPLDSGERMPCGLPENVVAADGTLPYMIRRGISLADAQAFGLGFVSRGRGWLQNRLVFPVWQAGQCVYWQARACWDKEEHERWFPGARFKKTLNPAVYFCSRCRMPFPDNAIRCGVCNAPQQFGSADALLNLEQAATYPRVAICEGPTSAIRTGPSAVASFGKVLQPQKIALLIDAGVKAVDFMWDGPSATEPMGAWPEMIAAAAQLVPYMDVRLVFLPSGDPGEWSRDALDYYRAHAQPFRGDAVAL